MIQNVGKVDRIVRIIAGLALLSLKQLEVASRLVQEFRGAGALHPTLLPIKCGGRL